MRGGAVASGRWCGRPPDGASCSRRAGLQKCKSFVEMCIVSCLSAASACVYVGWGLQPGTALVIVCLAVVTLPPRSTAPTVAGCDDDVFYLFLQKQKIGAELHVYLEEGTYHPSVVVSSQHCASRLNILYACLGRGAAASRRPHPPPFLRQLTAPQDGALLRRSTE